MAKRKTKYAERYWFAVGYHDGIVGVKSPPQPETVDFLLSTLNVQVLDLYEDGWKAGEKDKESGFE